MFFAKAKGTPVGRVLYAINHYISTGDNVGEGFAVSSGDEVTFYVHVNRKCRTDSADWQKLLARLHEISYPRFKIKEHPNPFSDKFLNFTITIAENDCKAFAEVLCEKPGPMGWGSVKKLVDAYGLKPYGL